ncbi:MAG: T9SS type A sorting domain-containing protein [Gemmatimonadetes bacterium]|nr:T9SS type A sorting domain-containing protein [Gemmatimonadota bacterium]
MNFHKTIGFLATLLLVLGLGVPDSYAQNLTGVTLSLNGTQGSDADPPTAVVTLADDIGTTVLTLAVTVSYDADREAGDTQVVVVGVKDEGTTAEAIDYASQPSFPVSITATVSAGNLAQAVGSQTIILTPVEDDDYDDENVVFEATAGSQMDEAILTLTDSEISVTDVTLSLNGNAGSNADPPVAVATVADDAGATAVALSVSAVFESALPADETRTVMVGVKTGDETTTEDGDYSTTPMLPVSIMLTGDGSATTLTGSTSIALTPATDPDYDDENIVFEATVEGSDETDEAILSITDADISVTSVTLSLNGTAGSNDDPPVAVVSVADDAGATAVAVTVSVVFESALPADETRTVMVGVESTTAEAMDYSILPSLPVSIMLTGDGTSATLTGSTSIVLTPATDDDTDAENIVLEATVEGSDETDEAILSITDADISASSVTLSLNGTAGSDADPPVAVVSVADNAGATIIAVTVSVAFSAALDADVTRTVMVGVKTGDETTAEAGDYSTTPMLPVSITLTGDGSATLTGSTNIAVVPARDADGDAEAIVFEATIGDLMDEAILSITDSGEAPDPVARAVTSVALSPDMHSLTEGMAFTGMVTVTVNVDDDENLPAGLAQTVSVALTADGATLADLGITSPVAVPIAADATSGMAEVSIIYTPPEDDNSAGEMVTITGMVGTVGGDDNTTTLNIADNDMGAVTSVSFSPDMLSLNEGMATTATVTVMVEAVAGPAQMVTVALASDTPLPLGAVNPPVAVVEIPANGTEGMANVVISYTPTEDDNSANETIAITGTGGGQSGTLTLNVTDNDMGAVTGVAFSPDMFSLTEGTAFTGTATVTVNVVAGAAADHEVTLSADGAALADLGISSTTVTVSVAADATSGMADVAISYTPPTDADLDDEMVTVTGMTGSQSGTLTLNVDDNTQSMGDIKVSTNLQSIRENSRTRNVVVTATLPSAPGAGTTVMVDVTVTGGTAPVSTQIAISGTATSGTATVAITPVNDEVFTTSSFTVTGSVAGYKSGTAMIDVVDDDASMGTLSVAAAPPSLTQGSGAQTVVLTVKVTLASPDTPIPDAVVVNVGTDKGTLAANTVTITGIKKHVDHDPATRKADGTAKVNLTLTEGEVNAGGTITVTASANMYDSGTRAIPIRVRDGVDVQGYRVVVVKPAAAGGWAIDANHQVEVDVMRVGSVAYPWTDFESIKVSVRDTAHAGHEINAVTAADFNNENGTITFTESGDRGDVVWKGNDTIRFRIQIHAHNDDDPSSNGQYLGAYATAEFTVGGSTTTLSNRDSDKAVYPSNPTLVDEANRYVGDGKLFKVDNLKPSNAAIAAVNVTNADGEPLTVAKVGDEVRVAIAVKGDVLFRESGMRVQIQSQDGQGTYMGRSYTAAQVVQVTKTINFTAAQVIAAADDSLRASWKITEGFFTYKTDDFIDFIGPRGTVFEADNTKGRVLASVKDQAGNWSGAKVTTFDADSRPPSVSILYPSADPDSIYEHTHPMRFSGAVESIVEGQNVDMYLNPLAILVDEDLSALKVFAVGADTLNIFNQIPSNVIGDSTAVYDTSTLSSPKKDEDDKYENTKFVPSSANRAGTEIELAVLATDLLGNTTKTTISGVTHDASPPVITDWFPKNSLLPEDQINDATPPIFTLSEDVDSISVTFGGSDGSEAVKQRGGVTTKGEESIDFSGALTDDISYDMTIFVRDLAGNVFITPADSSSNMTFNAEFDNPVANRFNISGMDSVIAGQANILTIQAEDHDAGSDTERNALTYKNAVRISAWDTDGGAAESVWFEGTGVTDDADNPDGVAMLSAADWRIGKRSVAVKSNMAVGSVKILVQHVTSGMGDTAVLGFESAKDVYVGAADFAGFEITAWEEGADGAVQDIWGNYTLRVVPVDRHGNASVRAFKANPAGDDADSLDVLDTRAGDNAFEYKNGIDVEIIGVPAIEDFALLILSVEKEGANYDLVAPDDRRTQTVQVRVVNGSLKEGDARSQNIRSSAKFDISAPLTPMLTLWVPGSDKNEAGNDVVIPADGEITVTVAAEGYNAGDMVTFTRNGTAMDPVEANDDGTATLMITASMAGTTTVSATNGRYSADELTIAFVDTPPEPARMSYVDANGDPVYLISMTDMTVGVDDFLAMVAAFGSSDGDANYNAQADVNDDGTVDVDDFLEFVMSFGRTAVGPATKPLVLLPGINENAEFSLSLGSERVVAGELVAVDVSLANVAALVGYGFALNYETDKFEFVSVAPADEDLLKSTGGETLFHHIVSNGQVTVANGLYNGTAVSGGGDVVRFVFRVLREFEDNARFEIADGLVFDPSQLQNPAVVAGVLELQSTPREFALHQNFPNPFNPDTTIKYDLAESADVTLQIYNVLGQVVRTLVASEAQNAGRYQIRWNGMDDRGVPVSSGIYFYQISADGKFSDVRKLMLLK